MQLTAIESVLLCHSLAVAQDCQTPSSVIPNEVTPTATSQDSQEGTSQDTSPVSNTTTDANFASTPISNTSYVTQSQTGDYGDGGGTLGNTSGTDHNGTDTGGAIIIWTGGNVGGNYSDIGTFNTVFDPIDVGLADKAHVQVDYLSMGAASLRFARVYHSNAAVNTARITVPMGAGWHMFYDRSLEIVSASQMRLHRANGRTLDFTFDGSAWVSAQPAGVLAPITGGWSYVNQRDVIETYDSNGRLVGMADGGLITFMTYDGTGRLIGVANSFGRRLALGYDNANRVAQVTLPDNSTLGYAYDTFNNLTSIRFADGAVRRYVYENASFPNALTGVIDESGRRRLTWGYDAAGQPNQGYYGTGTGSVSVVYNGNQVTTTDARGTQRVRIYGAVAGRQVLTALQTLATSDSAATGWSIAYDANGNPQTINTRSGEVQQLTADNRGRLTTQTRAAGTDQALTSQTTWSPIFHKPAQTVNAGITSNYTVDASGRVTQIAVSAGDINAVTYSATYNAQNLLQSITDVRGTTSSYAYDSSGNLASVTNNALGQTTLFGGYNAHGQPTSVQRPDGTIISRTLDARGRMLTLTDPSGTSQFTYDGAGRVSLVNAPDGSWKSFSYDVAGMLSSITNNRGETSTLARDATGAVTARSTFGTSGALAALSQRQFDAVGRVAAVLDSHGNRTKFLFGSDGRPSGLTNALNLTTSLQLDTLSRLTTMIQPNTTAMRQAGGPATTRSTFGFDSLNNLLSAVDTNVVASGYTYDALNRRIGETGADPGNASLVRNSAGDVVSITDALSVTYSGVYDAIGRISSIGYADAGSPIVSYTYVDGRIDDLLASMVDASGSTAWAYDIAGRVISKQQLTNGFSLSTTVSRDSLGRPGTITYPSGMQVGISYTGDTVSALTINGTALLSNINYMPFSQVATGWRWGNGARYDRVIDADGRVTTVNLGRVQRNYGYDAAGRITSQIDVSSAGTQTGTLAYDEAGQLVNFNGLAGSSGSGSYTYDTNGNRRSSILNGNSTTYSYAASSNRNTVDMSNFFNSYNADGSAGNYNGLHLTYGDFGRLITAANTYNPTVPQLVSTYNGIGQRVLKTARSVDFLTGWKNSKTDHFFYDDAGHLLGEYDNTSGYQQETVWFNGQPVATVIGGQTYYVHADNLGAPRSLLRASDMAEVWRWNSDPFGNALPTGSVTYNLRFPGQYADTETGFFQNGFRDYDPVAGRYIESDPIGVKGGLSRYAYVFANPLTFVDPNGTNGLGVSFSGVAEAGLGPSPFGVGVNASVNAGFFNSYKTGPSIAVFSTAAVTPNTSSESQYVVGAAAAFGPGAFFTNANSADDLKGTSPQWSLNTPFGSVNYSSDGATWLVNISGPAAGGSFSKYGSRTINTLSSCHR